MRSPESRWAGAGLALALGLAACGDEPPPLVTARPPAGPPVEIVRTSDLLAGPARPTPAMANPYEGDKNALADGERYYTWFNCVGCHGGAGGGGIGPPFADADWIYGGEPANIFQSIVQGRPNGMPSFGGQIPTEQVWKIVMYVRSLGPQGGGRESGESGSLEGRPQDRRSEAGGSGGE